MPMVIQACYECGDEICYEMDAIHDAEDKALELGILFYNPETFNLRGEQ